MLKLMTCVLTAACVIPTVAEARPSPTLAARQRAAADLAAYTHFKYEYFAKDISAACRRTGRHGYYFCTVQSRDRNCGGDMRLHWETGDHYPGWAASRKHYFCADR